METKVVIRQTNPETLNASINMDVNISQLKSVIYGYARTEYNVNEWIPEVILELIFASVYIYDIMKYEDVLRLLLQEQACLGIFDSAIGIWRPIVYMKHWTFNQYIMVAYVDQRTKAFVDDEIKTADRVTVLNEWPANNIINNPSRFFNPLLLLEYE